MREWDVIVVNDQKTVNAEAVPGKYGDPYNAPDKGRSFSTKD